MKARIRNIAVGIVIALILVAPDLVGAPLLKPTSIEQSRPLTAVTGKSKNDGSITDVGVIIAPGIATERAAVSVRPRRLVSRHKSGRARSCAFCSDSRVASARTNS
jgi:hypothetical protein